MESPARRAAMCLLGVVAADLAPLSPDGGGNPVRNMHFSKILQIFGGLVLGCIKTKFCKKICVRQHFSSSTRFASFCTAAISKFSQKIGLKKQHFLQNFVKFQKFQLDNLVDFEKMLPNAYLLAKIGA